MNFLPSLATFYSPLKRFYKFILKRLIGEFLESELDLRQLDVALSTGDIALSSLRLNTTIINASLSSLPLKLVQATVRDFRANIPWRNLLGGRCRIEVKGLELTLVPNTILDKQLKSELASVNDSGGLQSVLASSLASLNKKELRQNVKLHRKLYAHLNRESAEQKQELKRKLVRENVRRKRASARKDSSDGGSDSETKDGGAIGHDTDTDTDDSDNDTADTATDSDVNNDSDDVAASGLAVVASFIERIVSRTELIAHDIVIRIESPHDDDERLTLLTIHLPWIQYHDINTDTDAGNVSGNASDNNAGPRYTYDKSIRFHGFRVELSQPRYDPLTASTIIATETDWRDRANTIIHGDMDQDCVLAVRVQMAPNTTPRIDAHCFIRSVRSLLTPSQLSALMALWQQVQQSSAMAIQSLNQQHRAHAHSPHRHSGSKHDDCMSSSGLSDVHEASHSGSGGNVRPLHSRDFDVIDELLNTRTNMNTHHNNQQQQFFPMPETDSSKSSPSSPTSSSVPLYNFDFHLLHSCLVLLEEEEPIRSDWWLEPLRLAPTTTHANTVLLAPLIAGISVDHLLLTCQHTRLSVNQSLTANHTTLMIGTVTVEEYLQQMRLMVSTMPNSAGEYQQQQQRMGFVSHRIVTFTDTDTNTSVPLYQMSDAASQKFHAAVEAVEQPHIRVQLLSSVSGALDSSLLTPIVNDNDGDSDSQSLSSRTHVTLRPVALDIDLGLPQRLSTLLSSINVACDSGSGMESSFNLSSSSLYSPRRPLSMHRAYSSQSNVSNSANTLTQSVVTAATIAVTLSFPADTPSQSSVNTPVVRPSADNCFDSRGVLRCEQLQLNVSDLQAYSQCPSVPSVADDSEWKVSCGSVEGVLLYPREERLMTLLMKSYYHSSTASLSLTDSRTALPAPLFSKRFLSSHQPSIISILIHAPPLPSLPFHHLNEDEAAKAASKRSFESMFLDALPHQRWFEPSSPTADDSERRHPSSDNDNDSDDGGRASQPNAVTFENLAVANSNTVVHAAFLSLELHLSKLEWDLLLLLYTIADEIATPPTLTSAEENAASVSVNNSLNCQQPTITAAPSIASAQSFSSHVNASYSIASKRLSVPSADNSMAHSNGSLGSLSSDDESDADSDSSDLFESVVGADSVILAKLGHPPPLSNNGNRIPSIVEADDESDGEDNEESTVALSDIDSSDLSDMDSPQQQQRSLLDSQFGLRSIVFGQSSELTLTKQSEMFHSFVDRPKSLAESAVFGHAHAVSFVPAPVQPYKLHRPLANAAAATDTATGLGPSHSQPLKHKHWLTFRLSISDGSLCVHEELEPLPLYSILSLNPIPPSSTLPPHSYHLDLSDLRVFAVAKFDGDETSYVSVRALDGTLFEFESIVEREQRDNTHCQPVLFKSLTHTSTDADSEGNSDIETPIFVASFILKLKPALHFRETTAVLHLNRLTIDCNPRSQWIGKLTDIFTLACPPYVPSVGPAVKLTDDYTKRLVHDSAIDRQLDAAREDWRQHLPPMTQDLVKLYINCHECAIDYNPINNDSRAVLSVDHFHYHTVIKPDSKALAMKIEIRDGSLYLLPVSLKQSRSDAYHRPLSLTLPKPYLHHLACHSLIDYLDRIGFARVLTLDFIDMCIQQQDITAIDRSRPLARVEVTNGSALLMTAYDSFAALLSLVDHLSKEIETITHMPAVDVVFAHDFSPNNTSANNDSDRESKCDHESNVNDSDDRDVLRSIDRHAFGPDLGHAADLGLRCGMHFIDDYEDQRSEATEISLALQAAAEREIERSRREMEFDLNGSVYNSHGRALIIGGGVSGAYSRYDDFHSEPKARWFSRSELEERQLRDELEEQRHRVQSSASIETQRRREAEIEARVAAEREARRSKSAASTRRFQPILPVIIDDHIAKPLAEDKTVPSNGTHGAGVAAMKRLSLTAADGSTVPETDIILYHFNIDWRIFDGQDWLVGDNKTTQSSASNGNTSAVVPVVMEDDSVDDGGIDHPLSRARSVSHTSLNGNEIEIDDTSSEHALPFVHPLLHLSSPSPAQPRPMSALSTVSLPQSKRKQPVIRDDYIASHSPLLPLTDSAAPPPLSLSLSDPVTPVIARGSRDSRTLMELHVTDFNLIASQFPVDATQSSRLALSVSAIEIIDGIETSKFRKFLCSDRARISETLKGRDQRVPQVRLEMSGVRPDVRRVERVEQRIDFQCMPLRLNVDQDAIEFLIKFFSAVANTLADSSADADTGAGSDNGIVRQSPSTYIQFLTISTPLDLCIDYHPKRVDFTQLTGGDFAQLVHLFAVEHLVLSLKTLRLTGLAGYDSAASAVLMQWIDHISKTQLHHYLASVQPLRSLVNVGHGAVDCVLLPYQQYKAKGNVMRGVRKGAARFAKNLGIETIGAAIALTETAQSALETIDSAVQASTRASQRNSRHRASLPSSASMPLSATPTHSHAPSSLREGFQHAYDSLSRSLQSAAHSMVVVPRDEYARSGGRGAVTSILRSVPALVLKPMIGATSALRKVMQGATVAIDATKGDEWNEQLKQPGH